MFDDRLRITYRICNSFARWARLYCKQLTSENIDLHHELLAHSQSLPVYCAAAGAADTEAKKQSSLRYALSSALEISKHMQQLCNNRISETATTIEGIGIIDQLVVRLMDDLSPAILTAPKVRHGRAVRKVT